MIYYKILLVLNEGLIFGILAIGIYIAFQWLRFPDLTPDGSFVLGAVVYAKLVGLGYGIAFCLLGAIISGLVAGIFTASLNRIVKIPTVVAGLLTSIALYSLSWLILQKPNQFINAENTLIGNTGGVDGAQLLFIYLISFSLFVLLIISFYGTTIWGLKIRAIGENPLLASDFNTSETKYTFLGLGIANSLVGLAGALFAQRSYSADINMGVGQTIIGLIAMIIGLILTTNSKKVYKILAAIIIGSILHRMVILITLEIGIPAESFKLISAVFFIALFVFLKSAKSDFLKGLKWT